MTNFCQACGGQRGLHFSTLPGCTCVNPTPINYVINQQIKREWVGLTDEEIRQMCGSVGVMKKAVREAEAKLKEKNT